MENSLQKQSKIKSSLRLKSKTPLEKQQIHKINTIIMHLINHNDSLDFRQPVDWKGLQLTDYLQIIKHPMDLNTINAKFKDKKYKTVESVLNDIQLIWDNCKLYNPKGSDIYDLADKLQLNFRRMVKNYLPNLKVATITSVPIRPITQPPFTVIYKPDRNQEKPSQIMKKQFIEKLMTLSENQLELIINKIKLLSENSFIEGEYGWAKIAVENITPLCFLKLNNMIAEFSQQKME